MSVEIDIEYLGGLKTRATHGPSGATLVTVAPKDNQGDGSTFSPTDLCATSLAACIITTMAIAARKHGVELDGARVHVEKIMSAEPPRRIARLPVRLTMPPGVPEELRERLERAAHSCPVQQSLSPAVQVELTFSW
jgi:putative redox protein